MIIGLMGFECESPNKGCEALGYSFVSLVKRLCKEKIKIIVFSNDGLGLFPQYFKDIEFVRVPLKIKDISFKMIKAMRECDYIFDVTLGDSFSDIYSVNQCISNIKFKMLAELFGKGYYLLPQTYGPFADKKCRKLSRYIIKHANYVYCRDAKSNDYLALIGATNANLLVTTDMAFLLPYDKDFYTIDRDKENVGINISGLLMRGGFSKENQFELNFNYKEFVFGILDYFTARENVEVHLIPHVIDLDENAHDDDYKYIQTIKDKYKMVTVAPLFRSPIEAKNYISQMDFFVGSRMHSTIASFSSRVPTVPVSYSRKFEGLFDALDYPFIVHGNEDNIIDAISKVQNWYENREKLKQSVENSQIEIERMIRNFEMSIQSIIG